MDNDLTPVNTFRIIFNRYFGTTYERLDNLSFFSGSRRPYDFVAITDKLVPAARDTARREYQAETQYKPTDKKNR